MRAIIAFALYVEKNGDLEAATLLQAPFDRPAPVTELFAHEQLGKLIARISGIRRNAVDSA